jgi:hypothetical protein
MVIATIPALFIMDSAFIMAHPIAFFIESFAWGFIAALFMFLFCYTRDLDGKKATIWYVSFAVKFALLHVIFQLTGIYSYVFSNES